MPADVSNCLPGDIDCAEGAADAWDSANDPRRLARTMNYRLADLPRQGKLDKPVWADRFPGAPEGMNPIWTETYFPSAQGSTNARWLGADVPSPLEKYDMAFAGVAPQATQPSTRCGEGAKREWTSYLRNAGPATTWHEKNFHYMYNAHNGIDDDGNGEVDECSGGKDGFGPDNSPAGWWGLCHAWTPASMLEPEAINPVTVNGVTFERSDIHALMMTIYDANVSLMLGGRCNAREFTYDATTSANAECADTNAGAMHVVLANFLGLADGAIAFDRTAGVEVWNQPIYGYDVLRQDEVTPAQAMSCVGATGDTYTYNEDAAKLYETETKVTYVYEGGASKTVLPMDSYLASDTYNYILEVSEQGKILGGRYCQGSTRPDFMWAPTGPSESRNAARNPKVSLNEVRELLRRSVTRQ